MDDFIALFKNDKIKINDTEYDRNEFVRMVTDMKAIGKKFMFLIIIHPIYCSLN